VIPALDENGYLPVGVHECTLRDIKERFGSFRSSDKRPALFKKLEEFVAEVRAAQFAVAILVNGSFTTARAEPNDIDVVLVLAKGHDVTANLPPRQYNLVSRSRVQRRFGFDILAVRDGTPELEEAVAFFMQVRGAPAARKGMLRLVI
jgi:hypothetical protein